MVFRRLLIELVTSKSGAEYIDQRKENVERYRQREELTKRLSAELKETYRGMCAVCRRDVDFQVYRKQGGSPLWRESFNCPRCGFNARLRAFWNLYAPDLKRKRIYITEQVTPLFQKLKKEFRTVEGSEFIGLKPGEKRSDGIRHEDLTDLSFKDDSFDRILSFEVLEHVPDYKKALTEILRCLKPGARLILSVPFIWSFSQTLVRASIEPDGEITHHEPPDYHGNPVDPAGSLCYYYFSFDLLDVMRDIGFTNVEVTEYWSKDYVYLGTANLTYITANKAA